MMFACMEEEPHRPVHRVTGRWRLCISPGNSTPETRRRREDKRIGREGTKKHEETRRIGKTNSILSGVGRRIELTKLSRDTGFPARHGESPAETRAEGAEIRTSPARAESPCHVCDFRKETNR